jgi:putative hydrolase of the HAD superfamily
MSHAAARGIQAVVFDADDTLWSTEELYDRAREDARRLVGVTGLDEDEWERLERSIDVENVERFGHSPDRFPTSCVQAYEAVCRAAGRVPNAEVSAAVTAAARSAFEQEAPLRPHARETLTELRSQGLRLALLTKGDPALQRRRIEQSGLAPLFDVVEVVEQKTPESIRSVLERLGVDAASAISVGNSVRSDVLPSLEAGVRPVWIDAHVWEYERGHGGFHDRRVLQAADLNDVLEIALA